jgi:pimeloyl-[acyl-carrier protein] methyl ester esterase
MSSQFPKLILLPGLDGTGELFTDFVKALPDGFEAEVVRYPTDRYLLYEQLATFVESAASMAHRFVLVAESFSTPLAIRYAATKPPNLRGIVICAGFVASPARGWRRPFYSLLSRISFSVSMPRFAAKYFIVGLDAPPSLVDSVRAAIASVKPSVLSARVRATLGCDERAALQQVNLPILYLQADQDRLVDQSCREEIQRIRPETTLAVVRGPHLLFQAKPQATADCVANFVRQLL